MLKIANCVIGIATCLIAILRLFTLFKTSHNVLYGFGIAAVTIFMITFIGTELKELFPFI